MSQDTQNLPRVRPDTGTFIIRDGDKVITYNNYKDIPKTFDNLIKFDPDIIPPPHREGEHEINETWYEVFNELVKRQRK